MQTLFPLHPVTGLSTHLDYRLVRTLTALLPPPSDDMPEAAPVEAPAPSVDQTTREKMSENATNSQDTAFETGLRAKVTSLAAARLDGTWLFEAARAAMAEPPEAGRELPANGRENLL